MGALFESISLPQITIYSNVWPMGLNIESQGKCVPVWVSFCPIKPGTRLGSLQNKTIRVPSVFVGLYLFTDVLCCPSTNIVLYVLINLLFFQWRQVWNSREQLFEVLLVKGNTSMGEQTQSALHQVITLVLPLNHSPSSPSLPPPSLFFFFFFFFFPNYSSCYLRIATRGKQCLFFCFSCAMADMFPSCHNAALLFSRKKRSWCADSTA